MALQDFFATTITPGGSVNMIDHLVGSGFVYLRFLSAISYELLDREFYRS